MDKPMLFAGPMVRAILEGKKTQTRRIVDFKRIAKQTGVTKGRLAWSDLLDSWAIFDGNGDADLIAVTCPYGKPGDRIWVRECFSYPDLLDDAVAGRFWYWADGNPADGDWTKPKPSIHMPKWAARIWLEITNVRVERLQDISEEDALAEGCSAYRASDGYDIDPTRDVDARDDFADLWNSLSKLGTTWSDNPFVWVIEFKQIKKEQS